MTWIDRLPFTTRSALVGVPAALLLGLSGFVAGTRQTEPVRAVKIGVVDMDELLRAYPRLAQHEAELDEERKRIRTELDELDARRADCRNTFEQYEPGTEAKTRAEIDLKIAEQRFLDMREYYKFQLERMRSRVISQVYAELSQGTADWARKNGYDLVLRARPEKDDAPLAARIEENQQRDLLFHADTIDVTNAVSEHLKVWTPK